MDNSPDICDNRPATPPDSSPKPFELINVDKENVPEEFQQEFRTLHIEFHTVFDSTRVPGYNGQAGNFEATLNMGPVQPPQRKGRIPQYSREKLSELQNTFDELQSIGVFSRPEEQGITVEYVNPSFLIKKPNGGYRLVTAFADVGRYTKPQPSLLPDVDCILRTIASWQFLIKSDLTNAFYHIRLSKSSMKNCGVATPFKGTLVYNRSTMGMPGSETVLEELMCRILGDFVQEGFITKIVDDMYVGGNSLHELLQNWQRVLSALAKCDIRLSATKTVVAPKSIVILGWIWCHGSKTVRALRVFLGAFKVLNRVIPGCTKALAPLEMVVAGKPSQDKLQWPEGLLHTFREAQSLLLTSSKVQLPTSEDQLWIVTDGSVKQHGISATLYISRDNKPVVTSFFSTKLKRHQVTWLPCEVEALGIAAAVKHFSP